MSTVLSPSPIPVASAAHGAVAANTASSILSSPQRQQQANGEQLIQPSSDPIPPIAVDFALSDNTDVSSVVICALFLPPSSSVACLAAVVIQRDSQPNPRKSLIYRHHIMHLSTRVLNHLAHDNAGLFMFDYIFTNARPLLPPFYLDGQ
jgi:hypothetical protein